MITIKKKTIMKNDLNNKKEVNSGKEYEPFGPEWIEYMNKQPKKFIVDTLRKTLLGRRKAVAALQFASSVINANGMAEASERIAIEKLAEAIQENSN